MAIFDDTKAPTRPQFWVRNDVQSNVQNNAIFVDQDIADAIFVDVVDDVVNSSNEIYVSSTAKLLKESKVSELERINKKQGKEIILLRKMLMGQV